MNKTLLKLNVLLLAIAITVVFSTFSLNTAYADTASGNLLQNPSFEDATQDSGGYYKAANWIDMIMYAGILISGKPAGDAPVPNTTTLRLSRTNACSRNHFSPAILPA